MKVAELATPALLVDAEALEHHQTADTLRPLYPQWDRFLEIRRQLDPEGRFGNAYLDRVLGH